MNNVEQPLTTPEPFRDAEAAAAFLALPKRRVLELARSGEIPAYPIGNGSRRMWRFRLSELAAALTTRKNFGSAKTPSELKLAPAVSPRP